MEAICLILDETEGGEIWRLDGDHLFDTGGVRG